MQRLYWTELVQLKKDYEYFRRYRDSLEPWVTGFAMFRAVVSLAALGTWAVVRAYPMIWGGIIAAPQVADAVQTTLPITTRLRGLNGLVATLDALFIDCQIKWEDIRSGRLHDAIVGQRRHGMMMRRHAAVVKALPGWLPVRKNLSNLAQEDTASCTNPPKQPPSPVILGEGRGSTPFFGAAGRKAWMVGLRRP
jgi:hypothetical protein